MINKPLIILILSIIVRLSAHYDEKFIIVEQLGKKSSGLNGVKTQKNQKYTAKHGDTLELLYGLYPHKFEFIPPPSDDTLTTSNQPTESSNEKKALARQKRSFDSDSDDDLILDRKKMKNSNVSDNNPDRAQSSNSSRKDEGKNSKTSSKVSTEVSGNSKYRWQTINGSLFIMTSFNCEAKSKIAGYDLDNTLITTKSGYVFPQNESDWKILYPNVPKKLKELMGNGFKIVVFTNQNGIESGKTNITEFKRKIEAITEKLDLPLQVSSKFLHVASECLKMLYNLAVILCKF